MKWLTKGEPMIQRTKINNCASIIEALLARDIKAMRKSSHLDKLNINLNSSKSSKLFRQKSPKDKLQERFQQSIKIKKGRKPRSNKHTISTKRDSKINLKSLNSSQNISKIKNLSSEVENIENEDQESIMLMQIIGGKIYLTHYRSILMTITKKYIDQLQSGYKLYLIRYCWDRVPCKCPIFII